jgi:hypothetical protein
VPHDTWKCRIDRRNSKAFSRDQEQLKFRSALPLNLQSFTPHTQVFCPTGNVLSDVPSVDDTRLPDLYLSNIRICISVQLPDLSTQLALECNFNTILPVASVSPHRKGARASSGRDFWLIPYCMFKGSLYMHMNSDGLRISQCQTSTGFRYQHIPICV